MEVRDSGEEADGEEEVMEEEVMMEEEEEEEEEDYDTDLELEGRETEMVYMLHVFH